MSYMVLLSFEDEEQALTLVEDMLDHPEGRILTPVQEHDVFGVVEAIYKKPTMFCDGHGGRKTAIGFTMGQKWGWWVCAACSKPSKLYWANIVEKQSSFGKNLLDRLFVREKSV